MDQLETTQGKDGLWYWHFKSKNGKIRADGGEGYSSKSNATRAFWDTVIDMSLYLSNKRRRKEPKRNGGKK